ncbi:MAG: glycoside hydrolase family 13 protein [Lachnospiraceae bacterium]|nr:glycoside hydrolase family 13 protein [Lachnospiraceae bacterium]
MEYEDSFFSDTTKYYVTPEEPAKYDQVKIRIRCKIDYAQRIYLVVGGQRELMLPERREKLFEYFAATWQLENEPIRYHFEILADGETMYYDRRGLVDLPGEHFEFVVIPGFKTPAWAKGAVMYQIFVDRFFNGNVNNDVLTGEYSYLGKHVRHVDNWYDIPEEMDVGRFYGGDLEGVWKKLDYLSDLGVEAIYFNPLFVSPSNHKYDTQDYDYIDPHLAFFARDKGEHLEPDVNDNREATRYRSRVTQVENLENANSFFARFVEEVHERGIRVILDGVFNHCGSFHKWMDHERIYEDVEGYAKGAYIDENSPYHSYFRFTGSGEWPYNSHYEGWWGHETLPKLNYDDSPELKEEILRIGEKWISEPFCVDGWRLDVAADLGHTPEVNHAFWKDFRRRIKQTNDEALILAEHYGDASPWLMGDEWDSVMNYDAFMEPVSWYLTGMQKHSDDKRKDLIGNVDAFWSAMEWHMALIPTPSLETAMNQLSNHDHSRFLTRTNGKIGRLNTLGSKAASEDIRKEIMRQAVMIQMTWPGCPTVYYGDEVGVCGFTDPDNRRPFPWGSEDTGLLVFHKEMIRIRKENPELRDGSLKRMNVGDGILAYARFTDKETSVVMISCADLPIEKTVSVWEVGVPMRAEMKLLILTSDHSYEVGTNSFYVVDGIVHVSVPAHGGIVLKYKA